MNRELPRWSWLTSGREGDVIDAWVLVGLVSIRIGIKEGVTHGEREEAKVVALLRGSGVFDCWLKRHRSQSEPQFNLAGPWAVDFLRRYLFQTGEERVKVFPLHEAVT